MKHSQHKKGKKTLNSVNQHVISLIFLKIIFIPDTLDLCKEL